MFSEDGQDPRRLDLEAHPAEFEILNMLFDQHRPGLSAEPQNVKGAAGGGKRDADPSGVLTHEIINGGRVVRTHRWTFRDVRVSDCLVQEEEVSFHLAWDEVRFR